MERGARIERVDEELEIAKNKLKEIENAAEKQKGEKQKSEKQKGEKQKVQEKPKEKENKLEPEKEKGSKRGRSPSRESVDRTEDVIVEEGNRSKRSSPGPSAGASTRGGHTSRPGANRFGTPRPAAGYDQQNRFGTDCRDRNGRNDRDPDREGAWDEEMDRQRLNREEFERARARGGLSSLGGLDQIHLRTEDRDSMSV